MAAYTLMKTVLNGPGKGKTINVPNSCDYHPLDQTGTKERCLIAHLAYHFTLPVSCSHMIHSVRNLSKTCVSVIYYYTSVLPTILKACRPCKPSAQIFL